MIWFVLYEPLLALLGFVTVTGWIDWLQYHAPGVAGALTGTPMIHALPLRSADGSGAVSVLILLLVWLAWGCFVEALTGRTKRRASRDISQVVWRGISTAAVVLVATAYSHELVAQARSGFAWNQAMRDYMPLIAMLAALVPAIVHRCAYRKA